MKVRYAVVYKIHGANSLAQGTSEMPLLERKEPSLKAIITDDPAPHLVHIDKAEAIGAEILKSVFIQTTDGSAEERIATQLAVVKERRTKQIGKGVFVVFKGERDIPDLAFKARADIDDFGVCIDDLDKGEIKEAFRPMIDYTLAGLVLSLKTNLDSNIEKIGDVVFLVDPPSEKPVYALNFKSSVRASVSAPLTEEVATKAAKFARGLEMDKALVRPIHLLIKSAEETGDELQAFIAAWSAFEIFVNATFKSTYETRMFNVMKQGAPASTQGVFTRFKDVMSDKYRLADKFLVIASMLDADSAISDSENFGQLKKRRDGLLHALEGGSEPLPIYNTQKLLLKYMRLHLEVQGTENQSI